jgi:hypothetical protein
MKNRTLVTHRRYFGVDALALRESAGRVARRVVGLPPERARVSGRQLRHDFGVNTVEGQALVSRLVAGGLVKPHPERLGDFQVTARLVEFAAARVVEPLPRAKAKRLVGRACKLAEKINADWSRNPIAIVAIALYGNYLTNASQLSELRLGVVTCARPAKLLSRWRAPQNEKEGAADIRHAFEEMSSFVRVTLITDVQTLPRPFSIAWEDPAL